MRFDELDARMRAYETARDHRVPLGQFIVVRLDGRGFTRLTKEIVALDPPFDPRFRDHMVATTEHLMTRGFRVLYGHTASDEISLLLHPAEQAFGRLDRKIISILAGEASATLSLALARPAAFDGRLAELPSGELVVDYFRWRAEDARRNAFTAHCCWRLRQAGRSPREAEDAIAGLDSMQKQALLADLGVSADALPAWQTRGVGVRWEMRPIAARNPVTGTQVVAMRRRLRRELELPAGTDYDAFLLDLLTQDGVRTAPTRPIAG